MLTERGAKIYNEWCSEVTYSRVPVKAGDVLKDQLWSIMSVFGNAFQLGSISPFENCEIDLLEEKL